jgi:hypothetical protein
MRLSDFSRGTWDPLTKSTLEYFGQAGNVFLRIEGTLDRPFRPACLTGDFAP